MGKTIIRGEEVFKFTLDEFIKATRPDGLGHIYFNGEHVIGFKEVICDRCNAEITQPENRMNELVVFSLLDQAWCRKCFETWEGRHDLDQEELQGGEEENV